MYIPLTPKSQQSHSQEVKITIKNKYLIIMESIKSIKTEENNRNIAWVDIDQWDVVFKNFHESRLSDKNLVIRLRSKEDHSELLILFQNISDYDNFILNAK